MAEFAGDKKKTKSFQEGFESGDGSSGWDNLKKGVGSMFEDSKPDATEEALKRKREELQKADGRKY